jgi:hypothetical protein
MSESQKGEDPPVERSGEGSARRPQAGVGEDKRQLRRIMLRRRDRLSGSVHAQRSR